MRKLPVVIAPYCKDYLHLKWKQFFKFIYLNQIYGKKETQHDSVLNKKQLNLRWRSPSVESFGPNTQLNCHLVISDSNRTRLPM